MSTKLSAMVGAVALLAVLFDAGSASAADITGTPDNDVLRGTPKRDTIHGLAGSDTITPGQGVDLVFGDDGYDYFFWRNGDGHDRIDGGADGGELAIDLAGKPLRLHFDTPTTGAKAAKEAQVIGVASLRIITIGGGNAPADRLVLSSDAVSPSPDDGIWFDIGTGPSPDRIDLRRLGAPVIWINPGPGDDVIRLGSSRTEVTYDIGDEPVALGHDTIYGFRDNDRIVLAGEWWPCSWPQTLDANLDGQLSAKDGSVKVRDGNMTINLLAGVPGTPQGGIRGDARRAHEPPCREILRT
jgi:Ca2+-binding RTX toxin-like protein